MVVTQEQGSEGSSHELKYACHSLEQVAQETENWGRVNKAKG